MKKSVLLGYVLIGLMLLNACQSSVSSLPNEYDAGPKHYIHSSLLAVYPLDEEYIDAYDQSEQAPFALSHLTSEYAKKWEEKMNLYYHTLYEELDNDKKTLLAKSQKDWKDALESDALLTDEVVQFETFGSNAVIFPLEGEYTQYRSRALYLRRYCELYSLEVE